MNRKRKKKSQLVYGVSTLCLVFCVCFAVYSLVIPHGRYYEHSSITEVEQLQRDKQKFVVYVARNDCPACQKTGNELQKHNKRLKENVYRIETRTDKEQKKVRDFLNRNHIESVPSFVKVSDNVYEKRVQFDYVLSGVEGE